MPIKQIISVIIPYVALPVCLLVLAGLTGLGIVVALDIWGDFYFVDGLPMAAAFLVVVSVVGLMILQPAGEPSTLERFKNAISTQIVRGGRLANSNGVRQDNGPEPIVTATDFNAVVDGATPYQDGRSAVHSVIVWGKPASGSYNFNCSVKSEVNKQL